MTDPSFEPWIVIPARAGSKGIPNKNLALVGGVPLVARAIRAARCVSGAAQVIVSTDSNEIAQVARSEGAAVIDRPPQLSGDSASSESAVLHALNEYQRTTGRDLPEATVMLQCTSPFVTSLDLRSLVSALIDFDSAFLAVTDHSFLWQIQADGTVRGIGHDVDGPRVRRQDLDQQIRETGGAYAMRTLGLLQYGRRFFGRIGAVPVSRDRSIDIDESEDLHVAELLAASVDRASNACSKLASIRAFAFDFDGVMTDNRVFIDGNGHELVAANRSDGLGLELLRGAGVPLAIVTTEGDTPAHARGAKLGIPVFAGVKDKAGALLQWSSNIGLPLDQIGFVGNDINDVSALEAAGLAVCPSDAHPRVQQRCALILSAPGGHGAVRELCDQFMRATMGARER